MCVYVSVRCVLAESKVGLFVKNVRVSEPFLPCVCVYTVSVRAFVL